MFSLVFNSGIQEIQGESININETSMKDYLGDFI